MQWLLDAITDFYNKFVATLKGWYQSIVDSIKWVVTSIIDFYKWLVNWLLDLARDFYKYLYEIFLGNDGLLWYPFKTGIWLGNQLLEVFPDVGALLEQYRQPVGLFMALMGTLDSFFPITEMLYLIGIYLGFISVMIVVRIVLKVVPGLGG